MKSLMSARRCLVVALATAMILTGARFTKARTAGVTLVRDGVPQALLMVEAGAPKSMRAAEALQTYLERMSGAQLTLVIEGEALPDDAPPVRIHVGHTTGDGFLAMLLPPRDYAESNPEFYAMNKQGNRTVTPKTGVHHAMLCMSNPEVLAESIRNLRLAFAGEKRIGAVTDMGVGLSPPDGTPFCYCPDCEKASQNFRFPECRRWHLRTRIPVRTGRNGVKTFGNLYRSGGNTTSRKKLII